MKTSRFWLAVFALGALAWPASQPAAQPNGAQVAPVGGRSPLDVVAPKYGAWGYDATGRDLTVSPGTDFFRYADGAWYDREVIPADRTRFGVFDRLVELSENRTRLLIEQAAAGNASDPDAMRVGDAYRAFMNDTRTQQLDAQPLQP